LKRVWVWIKEVLGEPIPVDRKEAERRGIEDDDEFEFATNWVRAFQKVYKELKWLNAFAIINQIAI